MQTESLDNPYGNTLVWALRGRWQWIGQTYLQAMGFACRKPCCAEWAEAVGVECGPIPEPEKEAMIFELDAVVAHLYGLTEAHVRHIFETFHEGWDYQGRLGSVLHFFGLWQQRNWFG